MLIILVRRGHFFSQRGKKGKKSGRHRSKGEGHTQLLLAADEPSDMPDGGPAADMPPPADGLQTPADDKV